MTREADDSLVPRGWPELVRKVQARTPARLLQGRAGAAYRTATQMELRAAHAAARDAVRAELDMATHLGSDFIQKWDLFEVRTQAASKDEYLLRPDLGRRISRNSQPELTVRCPSEMDLQIFIGDGLSVTAVAAQVPALLPQLHRGALARGWSVGQAFVVRYCRVGILNEVGELLSPKVAVLLIGERPGLATAESLSAYMAYSPNCKHTDADRNLVSNIHARGIVPAKAAVRILDLAERMMRAGAGGTRLNSES